MGRSRKLCRNYEERGVEFVPQSHQSFLAEYMFNNPDLRGILLYHGLGSGKTCSAILIADLIRKYVMGSKRHFRPIKGGRRYSRGKLFEGITEDNFRVVVFSPGSLRQNFISEYCEFCGINREDFEEMFDFYSYNYSKIDQTLPDSLDNTLIIVDEVHNLINGTRNESKTFLSIYNKIFESKNTKIILLSGTPLVTYPVELAYIVNILKPKTFNIEKFSRYIVEDEENGDITIVNEKSLRKKIRGCISFVKGFDEKFYPEVIRAKIHKIPMSDYQLGWYRNARVEEMDMIRKNKEDLERLKKTNYRKYVQIRTQMYLAWSMMKSRQRSNFAYPKYIQNVLEKKLSPKMKEQIVKELPPDKLEEDGGWIDLKVIAKLKNKYSPKFAKIVKNILMLSGKHACYTYYKSHFGVHLLQALVKACGHESLIFSGDLDDAGRRSILDKFNSPENTMGEKYKVLFFTQAGIEGLTLLAVRHFHIVESDNNESDIQQAIGRVVRYKSHNMLPIDQRNVTIHRYFSVDRGDAVEIAIAKKTGKKTIDEKDETYLKEMKFPQPKASDELAYEYGKKRLRGLREIYRIMQEEAIDTIK